MTDTTAKIAKLNLNHVGTKKDGNTFNAIALQLEGSSDTIMITESSPANKYAKEKLNLKVGDEITLTRGGQYNSVQKISKAGGFQKTFTGGGKFGGAKFTPKPAYDSNGARNGMIVNASLALATARAKYETRDAITDNGFNKHLTLAQLQKAADDIKALTLYVEGDGSRTELTGDARTELIAVGAGGGGSGKPIQKAIPTSDPFADLDEGENFGSEDEEPNPF